MRLLDRDLRTPYQDEFTFSFEQEIFVETSIKASYIRRQFRDQLQDIDINHVPADHGRCVIEQIGIPGDPQGQTFAQGLLVPSPGEALITDPFTGEQYMDTDPGPGDGRLDDCLGELHIFGLGGLSETRYEQPDGRPDPYVQNPGWEELLLLGNFNRSDYEALVVEWVRRMYRNWQLQASYTWSKAEGDAEDFNLLLGNEPDLRDDESGFLDYDQTHVVKLDSTAQVKGFRFGGSATWQSGLPYSILKPQAIGFSVPPQYPFQRATALRSRLRYPTGQRNDQRNTSWFTLDLRVAREINLGKGTLLQISVEAFNILNDDTLEIGSVTLTENGNTGVISEATAGTRRFGRRWQLGLRLAF